MAPRTVVILVKRDVLDVTLLEKMISAFTKKTAQCSKRKRTTEILENLTGDLSESAVKRKKIKGIFRSTSSKFLNDEIGDLITKFAVLKMNEGDEEEKHVKVVTTEGRAVALETMLETQSVICSSAKSSRKILENVGTKVPKDSRTSINSIAESLQTADITAINDKQAESPTKDFQHEEDNDDEVLLYLESLFSPKTRNEEKEGKHQEKVETSERRADDLETMSETIQSVTSTAESSRKISESVGSKLSKESRSSIKSTSESIERKDTTKNDKLAQPSSKDHQHEEVGDEVPEMLTSEEYLESLFDYLESLPISRKGKRQLRTEEKKGEEQVKVETSERKRADVLETMSEIQSVTSTAESSRKIPENVESKLLKRSRTSITSTPKSFRTTDTKRTTKPDESSSSRDHRHKEVYDQVHEIVASQKYFESLFDYLESPPISPKGKRKRSSRPSGMNDERQSVSENLDISGDESCYNQSFKRRR